MATKKEAADRRKKLFMSNFGLHRYIDKSQTIATLVANEYLLGTDVGLEVGDLILFTGSDATGLYSVTQYNKTQVRVQLVVLKSS